MADGADGAQGSGEGGNGGDGAQGAATDVLGAGALQGADGGKPAGDGAKGDGAAPAGDGAKGADAPVEYTFKFEDGVEVDKAFTDEIAAYAKEHKLDPKHAQKTADFAVKFAEDMAERYTNQVVELRNQWANEVRADKELGGDKLPEVLAGANKVLAEFGSAELIKVLKDSGLGNHPEVVRVFHNVHKLISQDSVAQAIGQASSAGKTREQKYYG